MHAVLRRLVSLAVSILIALAVIVVLPSSAGSAVAEPLGSGSYTTIRPAGGAAPTACEGIAADPRRHVTANAPRGAVPTNDWWSSLLFKRYDCAYSEPLHAHPLSFEPVAGGLGVAYSTEAAISGTATGVGEYHFPYTRDVTLGVTGLDAPEVKVDGWTDWTVTPYWSDGAQSLRTTIGHGLPFVYAEIGGGDAELSLPGPAQVFTQSGDTIGFTVRGHDYVAFAPTGATWTVSGDVLRSNLAGRGYLSLAVLPTTPSTTAAERAGLVGSFRTYAHAHVTGTEVTWAYDQGAGTVRATYQVSTTSREGTATGTVLSLYPHQWRHLAGGAPAGPTYVSPRGAMRSLVGASSFTTAIPFTGVLPEVPAVATGSGADLATLGGYLDEALAGDLLPGGDDTYWTGKALGRAARLAEIADQLGRTGQRDTLLGAIRDRLTDWFTASPGKTERVFHYDQAWGTLVGYPASYGSDTDLNDHHFHYGYYIAAAATLAKFDPQWASAGRYGAMVDLLVRDANSWDRADPMFPFLRDFDIYAGHDWASGHGAFVAGNNQESSSEGMNFANALIQWGQATNNPRIRDAGLHLYTTQAAAIQEYWFDFADENFPAAFGHRTVGIVWGDGGAYATWFSGEPEMIQGINMLPITGGSLYLGQRPDYVGVNWDELVGNNGGPPSMWRDVLGSFRALGSTTSANADAALAAFRADPGYPPEEGESRAHTFHWLRNLAALGTVGTSVTADHPLAATFERGGARTYVASNITDAPITVRWSDGRTLVVPAGRTATTGALTWSGGNAVGGGGGPQPTPTPTSTPQPTPTSTPTPTPTPPPTPPVTSNVLNLRSGGGLTVANGAGATTVTVASAGGANHDGVPHAAQEYRTCGLSGPANGTSTAFDLQVDAGSAAGAGVQARVSYDFAGTGEYGRVETYHYFATDPVPGEEAYRSTAGLRSTTGSLAALDGGCVRVEVWNAIGAAPTTIRLDATAAQGRASTITIPYNLS